MVFEQAVPIAVFDDSIASLYVLCRGVMVAFGWARYAVQATLFHNGSIR
jgi:hypothetical protein